ncbi:POK18 protein, partial [Neopipo cinnamomea]|nr:POK18 protein [Neopipo cinnamomea]
DAPCFAFSIPSINHAEPMQRYHWVVLPQRMRNSPMICQTVVAKIIQPVLKLFPCVTIYHYMDDILIAAAQETDLQAVLHSLTKVIQEAGLQIAPEKIQLMEPWTYLGWQIAQQEITPQPLTIKVTDTISLNDLQRLLGAVNWLRPILGITNEELHPLFKLLKGDPALSSKRTLTKEAKQALQLCLQAIENRQGRQRYLNLPICLALIANLEWLFLSHSPPETVWTINDLFARLIIKGREWLQIMDGQDPEVIYIPATRDNLDWLLAEDPGFQIALVDYKGDWSVHFPKHCLWA